MAFIEILCNTPGVNSLFNHIGGNEKGLDSHGITEGAGVGDNGCVNAKGNIIGDVKTCSI